MKTPYECPILVDKYRPRALEDVIAQPGAIETIREIAEAGRLIGTHLWISGQTGTGKTTLALIIAGMISDQWHTQELIGRRLSPSMVDDWIEDSHHPPMTGARARCYIINEAHGLSAPTIETLLPTLENTQFRRYASVIFTTTNEAQESFCEGKLDAAALLGRCTGLPLARRNLAQQFADRCKEICRLENLGSGTYKEWLKLARDNGNNMRAMVEAVQAGKMKAQPQGA